METALYLIPVTLGNTGISKVLPEYNRSIILSVRYFIVENERTARRFLKQTEQAIDIDSLTFYTLNKHTSPAELSGFLTPITQGFSVGIISEAGCPAIADPGAEIVSIAQEKNIKVVPLAGPSSILLALMASGFNGQNFAFNGYLPLDSAKRIKALKTLEQRIYSENQAQIFIETPYRNSKIIEDIFQTCHPQTKLCIAADITLDTEWIKTKTITEWKTQSLPSLSKRPCIYAIYTGQDNKNQAFANLKKNI
ncbi:MAG: SAM-dependent methyltransferase [Dysgonamonadaceae bacterium]|jgi:16S rRNA (cytidine1402-2'-O)-methyltransferase|nr:SAM-dependent methyltransferase [Dysgonamonadaceae bacterium]